MRHVLGECFLRVDLSVLATTQGGACNHHPHVTGEETEAQKGEVTGPSFLSHKVAGLGCDLGSRTCVLTSGVLVLSAGGPRGVDFCRECLPKAVITGKLTPAVKSFRGDPDLA